MFSMDEEKDRLTKKLSEQYAHNAITMEEYERILEYINRVETGKEIAIIEKIIRETAAENHAPAVIQNRDIMAPNSAENHVSVFSWRTTNVRPVNGYGGKFVSLFGTNRIIVDNLPKGRTVLNVHSVFGLTEILVSKNIRICNKTVPVFSGIFAPAAETNRTEEDLPELYITGRALFGNITIKTM